MNLKSGVMYISHFLNRCYDILYIYIYIMYLHVNVLFNILGRCCGSFFDAIWSALVFGTNKVACEDCAVCSLDMCILKKLYEIIINKLYI